MTDTNIKGLPEGNYFTEIGYTDRRPWVEVSRTAKTVTLKAVEVDTDPEWIAKKHVIVGGFAGHCSNQHEQTWLYRGVGEATMKIHATKKGWGHKGVKFCEGRAVYFYDYNF